jgi:glucokinase
MLLAGDIGGTKTDLAVYTVDHGPRAPVAQKRFPSGDYPSLEAIAREFITEVDLPVTWACFAVAGPVVSGSASLTNLPWVIEEAALQAALQLEFVSLLNDVEATAAAVPYLQPDELHTLQEGTPVPGGAIALIAPGTGLGEAFLTWDGSRYHAYPSEGGHVDFAPTTPRETELLRYLQARWEGRVSYERVCAGRYIPDLYDFLNGEGQVPESPAVRAELTAVSDRTPTIIAAAIERRDPDPLCLEVLKLFVTVLGAQAGNLALTVLAAGGVYIAGGIPPHILALMSREPSLFLSSFHDKGRLSPMLMRAPVHVVIKPVALFGAALRGLDIINSPRVSGATAPVVGGRLGAQATGENAPKSKEE